MKKFALALLGVALIVSFVSPVLAQDQTAEQYLELMRQDLRSNVTAVFTEAMELTDAQGEVFWPIFRDFQNQVSKIGDQRIALIKDYAANYNSMNDERAESIMKNVFKVEKDRYSLRQEYYKKIKKELGAVVAARFYQVDRVINSLVDLQIFSELPLVQHLSLPTEAPAQE